jgi:hypothetical protein
LFTEPLPLLSEALSACGLQYDGEWLAPAAFDFRQWKAGGRAVAIARRHRLDGEAGFAVLVILEQYERVAALHEAASEAYEGRDEVLTAIADRPTGENVRDVVAGGSGMALPLLAEVPVAEAVLVEIPADMQAAAALGLFAEPHEPMAPRAARPALRWLRGKARERLGDVIAAEAAHEAAESMDPQWEPALYSLGPLHSLGPLRR